MAIEHLKIVASLTLAPRLVEKRKVSGAVRKAVLVAMVWQIPPGENWSYKAVTTLASETQHDRRTVQAAVRSLEEEGLVERTYEVRGKPWRGKSNAYLVKLRHRDAQADDETPAAPGPPSAARGRPPAAVWHDTSATNGRPMGRRVPDKRKKGSRDLLNVLKPIPPEEKADIDERRHRAKAALAALEADHGDE